MQTLPEVGQQTTITGISFPLTVESYDPNTLTANLRGEHPESGVEVLVPKVCLSRLYMPAFPFVGQLACLNSGSPFLTIVAIYPPLPFTPEGSPTTVDCSYFIEGYGLVTIKQLDLRAITLQEAA
jgi:hypothetical protein